MSGAFVQQLRASRAPIVLAEGAGTISFRVEASDIWDAIRVVARSDTPVAVVKQRVVAELFPNQLPDEFVLKLRGWEVLDERLPLSGAGIGDAAIVLLAYRRRRPVR